MGWFNHQPGIQVHVDPRVFFSKTQRLDPPKKISSSHQPGEFHDSLGQIKNAYDLNLNQNLTREVESY